MTSKTKPAVSAAIDAVNEVASPLDFSFKSLAGLQGLLAVFDLLGVFRIKLNLVW